jgi:hypothetical protein
VTIEVEPVGDEGGHRRFTVRAGGRAFDVTAESTETESLGAPDTATLVRASFEFLLEREPVGSILSRFDLAEIAGYFPEWRAQMRSRFIEP